MQECRFFFDNSSPYIDLEFSEFVCYLKCTNMDVELRLMDVELRLIDAVRQCEILFNPISTGYRDSKKRDLVWNAISQKLGMSVGRCMKRWKCLRDTYTREKRKHNGESAWHLYEQMSFLNDYVRHKRGHKGDEDGNVTSESEQPFVYVERDDEDGQTPPSTCSHSMLCSALIENDVGKTKRLKSENTGESDRVEEALLRQLEKVEDEEELFCRSIAARLRRLDNRKRSLAMLKIQSLLFAVEFEAGLADD